MVDPATVYAVVVASLSAIVPIRRPDDAEVNPVRPAPVLTDELRIFTLKTIDPWPRLYEISISQGHVDESAGQRPPPRVVGAHAADCRQAAAAAGQDDRVRLPPRLPPRVRVVEAADRGHGEGAVVYLQVFHDAVRRERRVLGVLTPAE